MIDEDGYDTTKSVFATNSWYNLFLPVWYSKWFWQITTTKAKWLLFIIISLNLAVVSVHYSLEFGPFTKSIIMFSISGVCVLVGIYSFINRRNLCR